MAVSRVPLPCDENHGRRVGCVEIVEQRHPVAIRETEVEQQHVSRVACKAGTRLRDRRGRCRRKPLALHQSLQRGERSLVVVDEKRMWHGISQRFRTAG